MKISHPKIAIVYGDQKKSVLLDSAFKKYIPFCKVRRFSTFDEFMLDFDVVNKDKEEFYQIISIDHSSLHRNFDYQIKQMLHVQKCQPRARFVISTGDNMRVNQFAEVLKVLKPEVLPRSQIDTPEQIGQATESLAQKMISENKLQIKTPVALYGFGENSLFMANELQKGGVEVFLYSASLANGKYRGIDGSLIGYDEILKLMNLNIGARDFPVKGFKSLEDLLSQNPGIFVFATSEKEDQNRLAKVERGSVENLEYLHGLSFPKVYRGIEKIITTQSDATLLFFNNPPEIGADFARLMGIDDSKVGVCVPEPYRSSEIVLPFDSKNYQRIIAGPHHDSSLRLIINDKGDIISEFSEEEGLTQMDELRIFHDSELRDVGRKLKMFASKTGLPSAMQSSYAAASGILNILRYQRPEGIGYKVKGIQNRSGEPDEINAVMLFGYPKINYSDLSMHPPEEEVWYQNLINNREFVRWVKRKMHPILSLSSREYQRIRAETDCS